MIEETSVAGGGRNEQGQWIPGVSGNPGGAKPETPEQKIIKKATKEIIKEYKENLASALPQIEPVLIAKAIAGDMIAVKEIHDRVMDKARQPNDVNLKGDVTVSFHESLKRNVDTSPEPRESI